MDYQQDKERTFKKSGDLKMRSSLIISSLRWASTMATKEMKEEEILLLAGDIENFLISKKGIVCKIKCMKVMGG